jgi:hypothetical protein
VSVISAGGEKEEPVHSVLIGFRCLSRSLSRVTGELTALVGARVMGEHRHPALVEQFTVLEGALSI